MRNAKAWLWGLIPLVVVWALANAITNPLIKADLTARTDDTMARQGQSWARSQMSGRDARIVSPAPSPGAKVSAIAAAVDTFGVRTVSGEGEVLPPRNPFTFSAERTVNGLTLKGYAPDDTTRNAIVAAAGRVLPGASINSQVELADGAPNNFAAASAFALDQLSRLAEGDASLSNTTLSISGRAATREGYNAFIGALRALPQGFTLASANVIPPRVSPFVFKVERGNGVSLDGFVPDEAARTQINAALARLLPGVAVTSRLELADGAPPNFSALANFALEQISRLGSGSVSLSGTALTLQGRADNPAAYVALTEALKALPQGATLANADISPPTMSPYEWSVAKSANGIVLRGAAPDAARREANVAAARALGGQVSDEQVIAAGAPADYAAVSAAAIAALSKLEEGSASLRDRALIVNGRAASREALEEVRKALPAQQGLTVTETVTAPQPVQLPPPVEPAPLSPDLIAPSPAPASPPSPVVQTPPAPVAAPAPVVQASPPPPTPAQVIVRAPEPASAPAQSCKERVTSAVGGRRVMFARSRAEIDAQSNGLLRGIASALKDCGAIDIAIEGHADRDGQAANNLRLSEARAAAVRDALQAAGAGGARLTSTGFGFSKPVAANDTKDNKAKNRRVEFIIR